MHLSIKQLIALATASLTVLLLASAGLSIAVFASAEKRLARSLHSYEQLAIVSRIESDASRALLAEAVRREGLDAGAALEVDAQAVNRALEALIERIRQEISSIGDSAEQAEEAQEFVAAFAIREAYARLARALARDVADVPGGRGVGSRSPGSIDPEALALFLRLNEQLGTVVSDERRELAVTLSALDGARQQLRRYAVLVTALAVLGIIAAALISYRRLLTPLANLDRGSAQLAAGNIAHRIAMTGPREFRQLAERLNEMAGRLDAQSAALRNSNEELEGAVLQRTRELADKAQRLQSIDESRRLFFAKVGHELRTPLTVLLGEAELALSDPAASPTDYQQALTHIAANGEHMQRRIEDLLALARSEDGRLVVRPAPVDFAGIGRATVQATLAYARSNELGLVLKCPERPLAGVGDAGWLRQALMALIDNAVKFSPAGADIELRVSRENDCAVFTVVDHGPGVPEAELRAITEPYFQSSSSPSRAGTGLGLAVAHWVAGQHAGRLTACNLAGGGFAVELAIPLEA